MQLEYVIAGIMLVGLVIYALTGGADFGGGMWDLLAFGERGKSQRVAIANAIAPVWEANHVWLILVIVLLFSAFPPAFAAIMTTLNIPMTLVLVGIVLRGSAFVFRKYSVQNDQVFRRWSTIFGVASFLTPFFLGINLGALGTGNLQVVEGVPINGFYTGWTTPFAIGCGIFALGLFAFVSAVYLAADTHRYPDLQTDFRRRALVSGVLLAPIAVLVFGLSRQGSTEIFNDLTSWWGPLLLLVTSICAVGALWAVWQRRFTLARFAAAGQVACILLGWGLAQFPYLVVPDLTISNAAAPPVTLRLLVIGLSLGAFILFPSLWYLFRVFKGRGDPLKIGDYD